MSSADITVTVSIRKSGILRVVFVLLGLVSRLAYENARLRLVMRKRPRLKRMAQQLERDTYLWRRLTEHLDDMSSKPIAGDSRP